MKAKEVEMMYLSDLRLSNVEISVAHAASSVTARNRAEITRLVMCEQKPGWYAFPIGALKVLRYRSVKFDHSLVCMIS